MKKKLFAGALALILLLGFVTTGWAGSQSDPLISLSYLTGTFFDGLKTIVTQRVAQDTRELEDKAGQTSQDGWITSFGFVPGGGGYSDTVTLTEGSGLIWSAGSGAVSSGVLVDATAGTELTAGRPLTAGHRYLAGSDAVVVASSQAQWMTEGKWRLGTGGTVILPLPFDDVPESAWYYDDVRFVYENGLFEGVGDGLFSPGTTMERGMMTTVLHRLAKEPAASYSLIFTDVPDGQWYTEGIIWCAKTGIVEGMGDGLFAPAQTVTRQQIAVMLHNYAVKTGRTAGERGDLNAFLDAGEVADWAQEAMSWAVGAHILEGSDGLLLPEDGAQRAQVAAMVHRFRNWTQAQDG